MASLLLIFALVLGIAGGFLLYYDRTQRATDAQRDTRSQQDTDPQRQDAAADESDDSLPEQSQGGKPQHNQEDRATWEDLDAPSHTDSEAVTDAEDEDGTEAHSGFVAKYSPSPDIDSDSSSATSGRHHRTADDSDRNGGDKASEDSTSDATANDDRGSAAIRASESASLSGNDFVKGDASTTTTATSTADTNAAPASNSGSANSSSSSGSADRAASAGSAHNADNTEKTGEAGRDSAAAAAGPASDEDPGVNHAVDADAESEAGADGAFQGAGHEGAEEQPEGRVKSKAAGRPRPLIPGTIRRERKNWAETRGFEYMKSDQYLVDEWTRGVASSGAAPKDIVAGNVYGHEMLLMDIDGVNVMAMRTGAASDVVIDFQRFDSQEPEMSEDLLLAMNIEGFEVYSSDRGVTERMVDERVRIALQRMPEVVSALWLETEWVLAQTTKHSRTADWEAMLPPLALLADAARVLPPRSSSVHIIHFEDLDPAREIPAAPVVEAVGGTTSVGQPEFSRPVIQRPEEPLDMPSRTYSETRGPVEHTAIGADEVDAIADGNERPTPDSGAARLPRRQFGEASIFGDTFGSAFGGSFSGGLGDASPGPGKDAAKNAAKDTAEGAAKDAAEGSAEGSSTGPSRDSSRGRSRNASGPAAAREKEDKDHQDESGPRQGE